MQVKFTSTDLFLSMEFNVFSLGWQEPVYDWGQ
jgi:hypothetical protein